MSTKDEDGVQIASLSTKLFAVLIDEAGEERAKDIWTVRLCSSKAVETAIWFNYELKQLRRHRDVDEGRGR